MAIGKNISWIASVDEPGDEQPEIVTEAQFYAEQEQESEEEYEKHREFIREMEQHASLLWAIENYWIDKEIATLG